MLISVLISKLQEEHAQHGDVDVSLYDNGTRPPAEREIPSFDVEFNTDSEEPVVLLSF